MFEKELSHQTRRLAMADTKRREFLTTVGVGPVSYAATAHGYPANDTINIGCLGTGDVAARS